MSGRSKLFYLPKHSAENGNLVVIENDNHFTIRRSYFVYGVPNKKERGGHAHKKTNQILICLTGKLDVICSEKNYEERFRLDSPARALYIPNMVWDSQIYHDENTIMLVYADTKYDTTDYIHDFGEFLKYG